MKIKSITRLVSDQQYGNLSMVADLADNEDPIEAAKELDTTIRKSLKNIGDHVAAVDQEQRDKSEAVDILKAALQYAEDFRIPF